jgi:DNA repair protein RadD
VEVSLYPHQEQFVTALRASLAKHRRVIACARTGFGKSRVAKWIAAQTAANDFRVLVAVHRRGLVDNLSDAFCEDPELRHGILMSNEESRVNLQIQIASIDSLLAWYCEGEYDGPQFDLIIYDEAHSHHPKLIKYLKSHGGNPFVIGLTATPEAKGLADVYRDIVLGKPASWLEMCGFASPFRYVCGQKGRLELLEKQGYRYTDESQDRAMGGLQGEFVRDWMKWGKGRPTVGFFPRLSHARQAQEELGKHGIEAGYVDGTTPDESRRRLFRSLATGGIAYLANVGVVERGTNIPAIECIQLCLAIGDRKRYLQMLGRGSRIHAGKGDCLILDHGDNVRRHGLYTDEPAWTLDRSEKLVNTQQPRSVIECPQCQAMYRGGRCSECGYEPSARERKSVGLQWDGKELAEYKPRKRVLREMPPEKILLNCLYRAARSGRTYRQACGMAKSEATKRGQKMVWPKELDLGHTRVKLPVYGDPIQQRRVADIYPWMA